MRDLARARDQDDRTGKVAGVDPFLKTASSASSRSAENPAASGATCGRSAAKSGVAASAPAMRRLPKRCIWVSLRTIVRFGLLFETGRRAQ